MKRVEDERLLIKLLDLFDRTIIDGEASKSVVALRMGRIWGILSVLDDYSLFRRFEEYAVKSLRRHKDGNKHLLVMFSEEIEKAEAQVNLEQKGITIILEHTKTGCLINLKNVTVGDGKVTVR